MDNIVELARRIATEAHANQVDKAGVPYIEHPKFVADQLSGEDEKAVAYLHDVLEDTDITADELATCFPDYIVEAIRILTKTDGEDYDTYLGRVKRNPLAKAVKQADLTHNMMLSRISEPTETDYRRLEKYKHAYATLSS